jgi:hypothetical protein
LEGRGCLLQQLKSLWAGGTVEHRNQRHVPQDSFSPFRIRIAATNGGGWGESPCCLNLWVDDEFL